MTEQDRELLESYGWIIDCESPLEISHEFGSRATGIAVSCVIESCYVEESLSEMDKTKGEE